MLLANPLLLRYDTGFQLSFLATVGIVMLSPFSRPLGDRIKAGKLFFEAMFLTVSAELFIMPVLFSTFHTFSFAAILSNALLLPLIPLAMLFSFLTGLFGMASIPLGIAFSVPAYVLLHVITAGAKWFSEVGVGRVALARFGWVEGILWYLAVFMLIFFLKRRMRRRMIGV